MLPHVVNHLAEYISQVVSRGPHNVVMENCPFIKDLSSKNRDFPATLIYQRDPKSTFWCE